MTSWTSRKSTETMNQDAACISYKSLLEVPIFYPDTPAFAAACGLSCLRLRGSQLTYARSKLWMRNKCAEIFWWHGIHPKLVHKYATVCHCDPSHCLQLVHKHGLLVDSQVSQPELETHHEDHHVCLQVANRGISHGRDHWVSDAPSVGLVQVTWWKSKAQCPW